MEGEHDLEQKKRRTRRSLFGSGRPSDTDEWLKGLETKAMEEKVQKWHFDFRSGRPLKEPGAESPSSSHVYEALDEREVPEFYRTKTIRAAAPSRSSSLDQSPRKARLKPSVSLKADEATPTKTVMTSPRRSKRLHKANSLESTPRKKKKDEEESTHKQH